MENQDQSQRGHKQEEEQPRNEKQRSITQRSEKIGTNDLWEE